jgi:spore maturation protein CgeB
MRVLVVDTYYPAFLAEHYAARPGLDREPYEAQLASLYERRFGTTDAYSFNLRRLGHEAIDLVVNCEPLQQQWMRERGGTSGARARVARWAPGRAGRFLGQPLMKEVAAAQIADFAPDVVYLQDLWFFSRPELDQLRTTGIFVAGQIASPAPAAEILRGFDLLLTSFPHFVEEFRALGVDSEYLRIAFDERVPAALAAVGVEVDPGSQRPHELSFVGGLDPGVHPQRVELLERVCEVGDLAVWGYGSESLPAGSPIRSRFRGQAWGLDMYENLATSQMVVNRHIDAAEGNANNMRLYESTGVGAMLLTDEGGNLAELFESGRELVTYSDADDLVEKASHYLADADARTRIAAAGQVRTMRDHTYSRRIAELAAMLESRLG